MKYIYKFYDSIKDKNLSIQNNIMKEYSDASKPHYIKTEENYHLLRTQLRWALIGEKVDKVELHYIADGDEIGRAYRHCKHVEIKNNT